MSSKNRVIDKKKMTVAMFWPTYNEGTGTSVEQMARKLDPNRFRMVTIFLKKKENYQPSIVRDGHQVYCLSGKKRLRGFSFSILKNLVGIIRKEQIDVLHCHRHKPCFYGALANWWCRIPATLFHVHGLGRTRNLGRKMLNRFIFTKSDKVIGCAEAVRMDIIKSNPKVSESKVIALRNSVEFNRYADIALDQSQARRKVLPDIPQDSFICGTVARFGHFKGHSYLIKAFAKIKNNIPQAHLILVGTGSMEEVVRRQVEEEGLSDCIHFLGYRKDIPELMRSIDLFVLPSIDSEGMPLVLLESMAAGTPCVATRLSGIPEVINSDKVGRLVPIKDDNALAEAIEEFANMPAPELENISQNAKERIREHFSHSVVVKELEAIYEDAYDRQSKLHN